MEIDAERRYRKPTHTIDIVKVDDRKFCNFLEDPDRGLKQGMSLKEIFARKKKGNTAIPLGRYEVKITYSPKFRRNMPIICGVPGFEGVRIHAGNTVKDTEGCPLPGKNTAVGMVTQSRKYADMLAAEIEKAIVKRKEKVWITFHY